MSSKEIKSFLDSLLRAPKVKILIEGPPLCGKTTTILQALKDSGKKFVHLTIAELFGNINVQTMSIFDRYITNDYILFVDDIDTVFPASEPDFVILERFFSRKPNVIGACRNKDEMHQFAVRYFKDNFIMEMPPSEKSTANVAKVTFEDIGGSARAKDAVLMMASWCVVNASKVAAWGLKPPSGAILYGPPGTGKTLLAKAAANACHCRFFSVAIPDLLRCEVGESEKQLTRVFERARADAPSIVFIDEVQALFGRRQEQRGDSNRLVVQLLAQLEATSKRGAVFCLAATNAIEAVDVALLMPGRLEEVIEVGVPDGPEREDVLRVVLRSIKHAPELDGSLARASAAMEGLTASDIAGVCQKAAIAALMRGDSELTLNDILAATKSENVKRMRTKDTGEKSNPELAFKP